MGKTAHFALHSFLFSLLFMRLHCHALSPMCTADHARKLKSQLMRARA
jgi:hypothetical protein